jgi:nicotinate-nucleotide pyrophosphorylase
MGLDDAILVKDNHLALGGWRLRRRRCAPRGRSSRAAS